MVAAHAYRQESGCILLLLLCTCWKLKDMDRKKMKTVFVLKYSVCEVRFVHSLSHGGLKTYQDCIPLVSHLLFLYVYFRMTQEVVNSRGFLSPASVSGDGLCFLSPASVSGEGLCFLSPASVSGDGLCLLSPASVSGEGLCFLFYSKYAN